MMYPLKRPEDVAERSRRYGIRDGAFQAVMQGVGENYLSAFALILHATAVQIGLLSALPQLVGTFAQLLSVKVMNRFRHRKTLILIGALGQTILWVPLLALPLLFPEHGAWLLIACTVLYVSMGHFSVPAWTSLITDFVDPRQRGVYFGRRAKIMAVTSFAVLLGAGFVLQSAKLWREPWMGFAVIFIVASAARGVSTYYLARIEERSVEGTRETEFRLMEFIRGQHGSNFQRFLLFSGLMHVCVLIAGPYFLIYLLRDLQFSYLMYAAWMAAGTLGQFLTLKSWGRLGDRFGNKKVLVATGILVPFLPMLYIVSTNFYFLVLVNLFGGIVWAGLSMGLQNYIFDTVRAEDRAKSVAVWNTVNAVGWCIGALLGGWLAMIAPSEIGIGGWHIQLMSNLPVVFFVSGLLRLLVSLTLLGTFREARDVEPITFRELLVELPLIKPMAGALVIGTKQVAVMRAAAPTWLTLIGKPKSIGIVGRRGMWRRRRSGGKWRTHSGDLL